VKLNAEIGKAVRAPELRKRYLERGIELTASASPLSMAMAHSW